MAELGWYDKALECMEKENYELKPENLIAWTIWVCAISGDTA